MLFLYLVPNNICTLLKRHTCLLSHMINSILYVSVLFHNLRNQLILVEMKLVSVNLMNVD
jgi:hypothetical protein